MPPAAPPEQSPEEPDPPADPPPRWVAHALLIGTLGGAALGALVGLVLGEVRATAVGGACIGLFFARMFRTAATRGPFGGLLGPRIEEPGGRTALSA